MPQISSYLVLTVHLCILCFVTYLMLYPVIWHMHKSCGRGKDSMICTRILLVLEEPNLNQNFLISKTRNNSLNLILQIPVHSLTYPLFRMWWSKAFFFATQDAGYEVKIPSHKNKKSCITVQLFFPPPFPSFHLADLWRILKYISLYWVFNQVSS